MKIFVSLQLWLKNGEFKQIMVKSENILENNSRIILDVSIIKMLEKNWGCKLDVLQLARIRKFKLKNKIKK